MAVSAAVQEIKWITSMTSFVGERPESAHARGSAAALVAAANEVKEIKLVITSSRCIL
jgi:hypothetical protein